MKSLRMLGLALILVPWIAVVHAQDDDGSGCPDTRCHDKDCAESSCQIEQQPNGGHNSVKYLKSTYQYCAGPGEEGAGGDAGWWCSNSYPPANPFCKKVSCPTGNIRNPDCSCGTQVDTTEQKSTCTEGPCAVPPGGN